MRSSIRTQILLPFCATLLASVAIIAVTSAWLAVQRVEQQTMLQIRSVVDTLTASRLTYTEPVLDKMAGLSGAQFVAIDRSAAVVHATLSETEVVVSQAAEAPLISSGSSLSELPVIDAGGNYFAARIQADGAARVSELIVLYPESSWQEARRAAIWPPLVVGAVTVVVMALISVWLADRIGRRVSFVQSQLAAIADGEFPGSEAAPTTPRDELDDLVASAGRLSAQLQELQQTIRDTERVRLMAQLAGGLAHQLRNAVTGARMAVQLHEKRCAVAGSDESLTVALRQLELTEEQIRGLLALSRREESAAEPGRVLEIVHEVEQLVGPQFRHSHVELVVRNDSAEAAVSNAAALRGTLLNVVLNGLEAAGPDGRVEVTADCIDSQIQIEVTDSGDGPPASIRESLFEPFVTSKPEGVGFGLALARQSIESLGGSLDWSRRDETTVFRMTMPIEISGSIA